MNATTWTSLHDLFADMRAFAAANPEHVFTCADTLDAEKMMQPTLGWVAFREDPSNEQAKSWVIAVRDAVATPVNDFWKTRAGRDAQLRAVVGDRLAAV